MDAKLDARYRPSLYKVAKCLQMAEIPFVRFANRQDVWPFLEQATAILQADVVYSSADDAARQVMQSMKEHRRLVLVLEDQIKGELWDVVERYLQARDPLKGSETPDPTIHPEHRLLLIASPTEGEGQARYLRDVVTAVVVG